MKIPRILTPKQVDRFKYMSGFTLASVGLQLCASRWEMVNAQANFADGPYNWEGQKYTKSEQTQLYAGYITEYTNKDDFCTSWVIMPGTSLLPDAMCGIGYLLVLLWIFIGIAIAADIFMEAIEEITSKTTMFEVVDEHGQIQKVEKPVWNATIANLSLMALGSSAPEILLAINDVVTKLDETPSELGPQSIVGSAAFNMLVISGVSIMAVTEPKKINDIGVFIVTSVSATWAYVWFFLVLGVISPGEVELWEAILTVAFFVILIILAYIADRFNARKEKKEDKNAKQAIQIRKTALRAMSNKFGTFAILEAGQGRTNEGGPSEAEVQNIQDLFKSVLERQTLENVNIDELMDALNPENPLERIVYRKQVANASQSRAEFQKLKTQVQVTHDKVKVDNPNPSVCFKTLKYSVTEKSGVVNVTIQKHVKEAMTVRVRTVDGTATAPGDYVTFCEMIELKEGDTEHTFAVKIIDDASWEPDKEFTLELLDEQDQQLPGDDCVCTVVILDEDRPGNIGFKERFIQVRRKDLVAFINIERSDGSDGEISCLCRTILQDSIGGKKLAKENSDFIKIEQTVVFGNNETVARVKVAMPNCTATTDEEGEEDVVSFALELSEPSPKVVKISKKNICFIDIVPENALQDAKDALAKQKMMQFFMDSKDVSWGQQFKNAIMLGPKIDEKNFVDDVTCGEAIMHLISMPWKVFFSLIPPKKMCGGWLAFMVALALIGGIVSVVGEFAGLLGCTLSIKTSVTAITLVALGTSLPDTFASKAAAQNSEYADSAIGNVTGSNSVNVFLGMGLPWIIATIYHKVNYNSNYKVPAGSLTFSVIIFLICSMFCFMILIGRRIVYKGELGGPEPARSITGYMCFLLWFIYVIMLTLDAYDLLPGALQDDADILYKEANGGVGP